MDNSLTAKVSVNRELYNNYKDLVISIIIKITIKNMVVKIAT